MNDTPGWASPGAAPGGDDQGTPRPGEPTDRPADATGPASKWSKEQPPAGDWSAPGGGHDPARTPPPQSGGQPGWGAPPPAGPGGPGWGGWQGAPRSAKPGVIPLRPLGVGELLDGAVSTMRTYWRTVLGISLTVAVVTQVVAVLVQGTFLDDVDTGALDDPNASLSEVGEALTGALLGIGVLLVITLLGTIVATALLTTVTSRAVLGRPVSTAEAWADARPQLPRLLGLTLLMLLIPTAIVCVGLLPGVLVAVTGGDGAALTVLGGLAALVVSVWLLIRLSLASPALMLEKQGVGKAMGRSLKLVRGSWWRIFGITLLAAVIANVLASIIAIPFTVLATVAEGGASSGLLAASGEGWTFLIISGVGSVIASTLTFPVTAGVTVLLYIDRRIRREGLDLELARAAGVPGHEAPGAPHHRPPGS
ncbi:glycerophosphoryl diester phosphodiesterase membrane domain-containing protein [Streptomyces sp. JNUCC 64]